MFSHKANTKQSHVLASGKDRRIKSSSWNCLTFLEFGKSFENSLITQSSCNTMGTIHTQKPRHIFPNLTQFTIQAIISDAKLFDASFDPFSQLLCNKHRQNIMKSQQLLIKNYLRKLLEKNTCLCLDSSWPDSWSTDSVEPTPQWQLLATTRRRASSCAKPWNKGRTLSKQIYIDTCYHQTKRQNPVQRNDGLLVDGKASYFQQLDQTWLT